MERQDAKSPSRHEPSEAVDEFARRVIGCAIDVHRELGPGFPESVYEESLSIALTDSGIRFERQPRVNVYFRERLVGQDQLDLWIERQLVVELKTVEQVAPKHKAQVKAYLAATGNHLGLLINKSAASLCASGTTTSYKSDAYSWAIACPGATYEP
ncbi:MAG: GxxExxY protein, partial [Planctomycetota bacterium]